MKALLRDVVAGLLRSSGLTSPARRRPGELLILTFHRVLPDELRREYPLPGLAVTPEELRWVLAQLQSAFVVGTVTALSRRQAAGALDRPGLAVSFDDGQWDNVAFAAPVLREFGVDASFYLPTDYIGSTELLWHDRAAFAWCDAGESVRADVLRRLGIDAAQITTVHAFLSALKRVPPGGRLAAVDELAAEARAPLPEWARMMDWADAAGLRKLGHEIGSHACSHGLLPQMSADEQRRELADSAAAIAANLGERPNSLCYPNGSFDASSLAMAKSEGYENAVTTQWGINRGGQSRHELLRCDMDARRLTDRHGRLSGARLAMRLAGLQPGLR